MTESRPSISLMSYKKKDDVRILTSCLSNWFSNPKILHFVSPSMRYPFKIKRWINKSYSTRSNTLVLKLDNWIIGHISIRMNDKKKSAHIFHLIIDPDQRQKGYGKLLFSHAEEFIIKNDFEKITINVLIKNQIAKNFYKKSGFLVSNESKPGIIKMLKELK
tara:strand:- start:4125 stop:4610 length:486 start_codon:yes stop_codon:yes gene_type:complete